MGKKDKNKKKGKGAEKTAMKTDKKQAVKQKKLLAKIGEADIEEIVAKLEQEEARRKEVTEEISGPPSPRSNFTLCSHPEKEELVLFGGEFFNGQKICIYNDLYFYNIPKNEWKIVRSPAGPAPRSGHQIVSIASDGGQLWLFGGEHASPSQLQFYHYKDLWVLRLSTRKWEKINAPNGPSPRSGHRMVAGKKKLIVFGGFHDNNQSYRYFNDVHIFSLEIYSWLQIEVGGAIPPPPRSGCCMAYAPDGKILIWGGYSKSQVKKDIDKGVTHTDMFALVPDKSEPAKKFKWTSVKPNGMKPPPRSGVGTVVAANGKVYSFGGVMDVEEDEEHLQGQFSNELYSLDLANTTWRSVDVVKKEKSKTKPKSDSTVDEEMKEVSPTVTSDGIFTITVAGSSGTQESASQVQKTKFTSGSGPSPRMNACLAVCKGSLYLFGGIFEDGSKQHTLNDFYSLDLHKLDEWKTLIPNNCVHDWLGSDSEGSESSSEGENDDDSDESDSSSEMDTD